MGSSVYNAKADRVGIVSAILCTVHCMLVPIMFLVKYWVSGSTGYVFPSWWEKIDYLFLLVSFYAVYHAASHAATKGIKYFLWLFWLLFALAVTFEKDFHWIAYFASAGLIVTHFINIRRHHQRSTRSAVQIIDIQ